MSKPTLKEALELRELKRESEKAYQALNEKMLQFASKYGEGKFAYKDPENDGYFRIELEDNVAKFERGESVYKAASLSKFQLLIRSLKNKPKEIV